jgi:translation elongation factor EF-1beta
MLVKPTSPDGKTSKLVAKVKNRIKERGGTNADAERVAAPARAYFGQSAFDGLPALIVDYRGQKRFGRFRDEVRHVGCGVWLGKTYLTDKDAKNEKNSSETETLAESLAAVGGVKLSPVVTAVIERAMPVFEPGEPPPHVLDFTLYATAGES